MAWWLTATAVIHVLLWKAYLEEGWSCYVPPVATRGMVYVTGLATYGVDGLTGSTVWVTKPRNNGIGAVAVADGVVYESDVCHGLYAFDALTGSLKWLSQPIGRTVGNSPVLALAVYQGLIWQRDSASVGVITDLAGKVRSRSGREPSRTRDPPDGPGPRARPTGRGRGTRGRRGQWAPGPRGWASGLAGDRTPQGPRT
jgi:outer membrane protein assembly factor BamB